MSKPTIENKNMDDVKSPNFFQKFFYLVLIPLLFAIAVLLVIASFTGTNVFEKAKELTENLPFVSSQEDAKVQEPINSEKIVELQAEIAEKEAQISQLQTQLEVANGKNEEAKILQEELEYEIQKLKNNQTAAQKEITEIITAFEKMSAKEAAPILVEMNLNEALKILMQLKPDKLSDILSKMNPQDAAKFTEHLTR
ncbi:MotE family protein [Ureibacillus manganicus]|uniref:Magnesium transporter MgtE intracellular domain-containing protein n=1 Tax=Ureibacillus manganicus DSM 26584 TaxID=1384049 RepID=A0A0A3I6L7_9BACL|nr:MotE family protein [Ureibacillus manganicus]KGR80354.1 hypothetical protein CD29_00225 [Ureibacillus manganicus DSM 26584]